MVQAFMLPLEIVGCPTVRESDGLAMSSRNLRLSPEQRTLAPELYRIIRREPDCDSAREALRQAGFKVDYVEDIEDGSGTRRLVAASLGDVRLIDNVTVE
jgi:pantoate--beta-alanine ligase